MVGPPGTSEPLTVFENWAFAGRTAARAARAKQARLLRIGLMRSPWRDAEYVNFITSFQNLLAASSGRDVDTAFLGRV